MYRSINSNCRPLVQGGRAVFTGDRHRLGPCLLQAILGYGGMTRIATLRLPGRRSQGLPPSNSIAFPATVSLAKHTSVRQKMTPNTANGEHFGLVPTELCCEMVPDALLSSEIAPSWENGCAPTPKEVGGVRLAVSGKELSEAMRMTHTGSS